MKNPEALPEASGRPHAPKALVRGGTEHPLAELLRGTLARRSRRRASKARSVRTAGAKTLIVLGSLWAPAMALTASCGRRWPRRFPRPKHGFDRK